MGGARRVRPETSGMLLEGGGMIRTGEDRGSSKGEVRTRHALGGSPDPPRQSGIVAPGSTLRQDPAMTNTPSILSYVIVVMRLRVLSVLLTKLVRIW